MLMNIALVIAITAFANGFNPASDLKNDFQIIPTKGHRLAGFSVNGNGNKCDLTRPKIRTFGYCFNDKENQDRGIDTTKERGWVREVVQQWEKCGGIKIQEEKACRSGPDFIRINLGDYHPVVYPHVDTATCTIQKFEMYFGFYTFGEAAESYRNSEIQRKSSIQMYMLHEMGHFLGFDHEHNRNDRQGECDTPVDKTNVGPNAAFGTFIITKQYDADSIMNYCTKWVHFKPWLSKLDKEGVKLKYGGGNEEECDAVTKPWHWTEEMLGGYSGIIEELGGTPGGSTGGTDGGTGGGNKPTSGVCADVASNEDCKNRVGSCGDEAMKYWCPKTCKHC